MDNSRRARLRVALGIVLPAVLATAALLPLWLYRERVPSPLATHWNLRGHPDGAMALPTLATLIAVLALPACVGMGILAFRRSPLRGEISPPLAVAGFIAGTIAAVSALTVAANLDVPSWREAAHMGFHKLALVVLAGIALAAALARASRPLETTAAAIPEVPHAGLQPGSRAVWVGSARASWAVPLSLASLTVGLLLVRVNVLAGIGAALTASVGLLFTSIRMTVDRHGVRVEFGPLHWPVQHLPLAEIRQASVLDVKPMAWGGWGYRGSLTVLKQAAVVLRGGEGVKLELSGDRVLVITIDNARQAAGLINDQLEATRSPA